MLSRVTEDGATRRVRRREKARARCKELGERLAELVQRRDEVDTQITQRRRSSVEHLQVARDSVDRAR